MSVGRIASYIHSDKITPNKGAAVIKVTCQTDFAAKTDEFIAFADKAAKFSFASLVVANEVSDWSQVIESFPDLEEEREALSKKLKEVVTVEEIVILTL
ncbi:putative elongation factor EF-Ts domain protein [Caulobacter phage CcrColossus]|uniref:Putative elongation factor EF-Ts domain protein n=1 Tax=Caulobacter phage CcrColossus TaxID=1211640 RepID=K4K6E5_9CAUD|nr:putative elongation factor EF-Ts domain protein [Caulobacter phage CcrColossus]AFU88117.1 putative elongation factor EF-Ts domain protein [Caulobacter phage CcrColossus]